MDLRQSKNYAAYLKQTGWVIEKIDETFVYIRKLPLTPFSVIKIQRPERIPDLKIIDRLAKKYRALYIFLEPSFRPHSPLSNLKTHNYKLAKSPYLPTKTIHLDLTQSEKKLLAQMKKDARHYLKKHCSNEPIHDTKIGTEIKPKTFYQAWKKTAGLKMLIPAFKNIRALKTAFGKNALLLTSTFSDHLNDQRIIIAGTFILIAGKTAYYYYAYTNQKGRELLAQYQLVWEAVKIAKKRNCQLFDFEGIYDPRFPEKSWRGFSHFKKSFGGKEINYPGCYKKSIFF